MSTPDDIHAEIEAIEDANEKANEKNEELGDGLHVGKVVRWQVADGYAPYEIVDIGDTVSKVEYRDDLALDGYRSPAVDADGNVLTSNLKAQVKSNDARRKLFD